MESMASVMAGDSVAGVCYGRRSGGMRYAEMNLRLEFGYPVRPDGFS